MKKKIVILMLVMMVTTTGCSSAEAQTVMDRTVNVEEETVQLGDLSMNATYIGTVENTEAVTVMSQVAGNVEQLNVTVGDTVEAGAQLCQLDNSSAELNYESAQASLASAEVGIDSAQASVNSAQASYNSAAVSGSATLGSNQDLTDFETEQNIKSLKDSYDSQNDSIDSAQDSVDAADSAVSTAASALATAKTNYTAAVATYKSADSIASTYASQISSYSSEEELESSVSDNDAGAVSLQNALTQAGLSYDNVTASGVKLLLAKMDSASANYSSAKTAYSSAVTAQATANSSLSSLQTSRDSTYDSLIAAQEEREITNGEVYDDTQQSVQASLDVAQAGIDSSNVGMESAQASVASAQVGVDSAAYQLSLYTLTTPISGIVEAVNVSLNNMCASGTESFVISNPDSRSVVFHVADRVASELTQGQEVTITSNGKEYAGAITEIGVAVDSTGLFQIKATAYDADDLADGINVGIETVTHKAENEVIVPTDAVYYEDNNAYVYLDENGIAVQTPITVDIYKSDYVAVAGGILAGDKVITSWSASLKDGAEVTVVDQSATEIETSDAAETSETESVETVTVETATETIENAE